LEVAKLVVDRRNYPRRKGLLIGWMGQSRCWQTAYMSTPPEWGYRNPTLKCGGVLSEVAPAN